MDDKRIRTMPLRQLGWGFLLAWVFCVFYTSAVGDVGQGTRALTTAPLPVRLFDALMPLGSSVVSLAVILALEPRIGAPTTHRPLTVIAPVLTALSTPFMFLSLGDAAISAILYGVGSVATGIGSALLWVMWGEYYAVISREEAEWLAPVSAVSAALLTLVVSATTGWMAVLLASLFPLLSGWCFYLVWSPRASREEYTLTEAAHAFSRVHGAKPLAGLGRAGFGILSVFAITSIAGMMHGGTIDGGILQAILVFSAFMMALMAVAAVSGPRRISLSFLYRWMCPTLVVGFAGVILFGPEGGTLAYAASLAGRFTFCLIAQVYFASYAVSGRATPTQATCLGWLFVHAGDLVGCTIWFIVEPWMATVAQGATWTAVICIVALVTITMLVLGDTAIFHRPGAEARDAGGRSEATGNALAAFENVETSGTARCAISLGTPANEGHGGTTETRESAELAEPAGATGSTLQATSVNPPDSEAHRQTDESLPLRAGGRDEALPSPDTVTQLAVRHHLTPRETEVFALLAQGRSIPYIRDELIISRETAATHAKHIYAKLGVHSRQELIDLVQKGDDPAEEG